MSDTGTGIQCGNQVLAARLLPSFGWQAVFFAGAILPAGLALAIWLLMPESS